MALVHHADDGAELVAARHVLGGLEKGARRGGVEEEGALRHLDRRLAAQRAGARPFRPARAVGESVASGSCAAATPLTASSPAVQAATIHRGSITLAISTPAC